MDIKENLDEIEIIDDFEEVTPKVESVPSMNIFDGHQISEEYQEKEPSLPSTPKPVIPEKKVEPEFSPMSQSRPEMKQQMAESSVYSKNEVEKELPETVQVKEPVVALDLSKTSTDLRIDEDLIHSSLENTMLLNKELLKAAANETIVETKDETKENKKAILFVIVIFTCLILFTALIPFILNMFGK